ncbi:PQQ-dependent sugar dehydrogenase [Stakelama saccharophila]|uniref:Sorbosone dehydrogenase family protein n=1 Tax=Stakelama saccharophila TaxID=3075605 RepID=A0ABZ0BBE3_9SPHN|nr:sorbosone dehydrogenase family protein [Stakelama sp. W311]WNO54704.1 sorbosone dehydrogenase family protein [Stakelama sp. W311]
MRQRLIVLAVLLLILVGIVVWVFQPDRADLSVQAVTGRVPKLTAPEVETFPTTDVAEAVGWPEGARPSAAAGLTVQAFARGLDHPRWLYQLPNGDVLVAETNSPPRDRDGITGWVMDRLMRKAGASVPSADRITLLRDTDGDGIADKRSPFLNGLHSPFGMALVGETLYVANTDALLAFPYESGQTRITAKPDKIAALPGGGNHWTRNILADPATGRIWVAIGSSSNIAEDGMAAEEGRARIVTVDPDTGAAREYATGMRNPTGLALNPQTGKLWAVVNARDMLGSDMPPDYLTEVDFGNFYGWPWYYWGGYSDPRVDGVGPQGRDMRQYTARPDYALGPHVAPMGLAFAAGAKLGDRFAQGAFVGEHGSWNRVPPSGYKVVYIPFGEDGFPADGAAPVDVLTGFLNDDGDARGRPVGVIVGRDGGLLVADDVGNTIWRVTAAAQSKAG